MSFAEKPRIALVQDSPVFFNAGKTTDKCLELIDRASSNKPDLIVFPESFIPGYPRHMIFGSRIGYRSSEGRELWKEYYNNSISVPGPEVKIFEDISKKTGVYLSMGITERDNKSLYCTQLLFSPRNGLISKHRKIKPTAAERIVWAEGSGRDLATQKISNTIIGTLICWENYMPLARMSMYLKGVNLYLAPTADYRESWQTSLRHIALEGRCFVIGVNQYTGIDEYPGHIAESCGLSKKDLSGSRGGSCIISPMGEYIAGPLWDEPGIICAELDLGMVTGASLDFDAAGHYNRPDIFDIKINDQPETLVD